MNTLRAAWLAWGASVALLAYPAGAQYLGQSRAILGGDSGMMLPVSAAPSVPDLPGSPTRLFDASDEGSITSPDGLVTAWASTGSNTASVTTVASREPTHSGDAGTAKLAFDGAATRLRQQPAGNHPTIFHVFAVAEITAMPPTDYVGLGASYQNPAILEWSQYAAMRVRKNTAGTQAYFTGQVYSITAGGFVDVDSPVSLSTRYLVEVYSTGAELGIAINGATPTTTTVAADFGGNLNMNLGYSEWSLAYFTGHIHEIVVYEGTYLSGADRTQAIAHMTGKWGL